MEQIFWGKYDKETSPKIHFDPLQSFNFEERKVGYRIHIVPTRKNRPRDQVPPRRKSTGTTFNKEDSILYQVSKGNEFCVPIAGDDDILGSPFQEPVKQDFSAYNGIAIINKYSPLSYFGPSKGIAVVAYPTNYVETLESAERNINILLPLQATVNEFNSNPKIDLKTPLIFFNIGPSSGASLRQLHAQLYMVSEANGLLTHGFNQSYLHAREFFDKCMTCSIANTDIDNHNEEEAHKSNCIFIDHLHQEIPLCSLLIWEDDNVRLIVPYAPIRALSMRILFKKHRAHIGELTNNELQSLGKALSLANESVTIGTPSSWRIPQDRTIAFRQTQSMGSDFHMFIDVMPSIPLGGAEVIDSISVSTLDPLFVGRKIQSRLIIK